ncbi:MAG: hypothetical protein K6G60_02835 [Lachnospiraceae bacterium]|nr:hypothetical protein [Lachnospiraceae bacterium]
MSEKKHFFKFILFLASFFALCFAGIYAGYVWFFGLPSVYDETYYAGLKVKYDRLTSVKEPKIVVIGGSSVAFGIDSKTVERETGMPCVNFGLYAAFGFKPMTDMAKESIGEGDIVILAPELSAQMYSDYVGYDYLLDALEGRWDMAKALGKDYVKGLLGAGPEYMKRRKEIEKNGLNVEGVYARSSFDEYGDMIFERKENIMNGGYLKTDLPEISASILTEEFFETVNSFADFCKKKGASVYFGFPPVNALSADGESSEKEAFLSGLREGLDFDVLQSLDDHIMDAGYFYDSNFHTNDAGTVYNTVLLINDIKRIKGEMTLVSVTIPEPYAMDSGNEESDTESDGIFLYALASKGIVIKGLTEEGKALDLLDVPGELAGYGVWCIDAFAFENAKAATLIIPESVTSIREGIIRNAAVKTVYINCSAIPEVASDMLYGALDDVILYIRPDLYGKFSTDYFWGNFAEHMRPGE